MTTQEIKREIKQLKKLKLKCRAGTSERLDLEHKIKDLKKQIAKSSIVEPNKGVLIEEIKILDPLCITLSIDLNKFTEAELKNHITILKQKRIK